MSKIHSGLLSNKTPLVFNDGSAVYKKLAKKNITHKKGYFILAPSGAGKTFFINNQKDQNWIDGDELWEIGNAHPKGAWWLESLDTITEIDQKSDVITVQAKKLGFWILGASNNWLKPDAIVLPHWSTHKKYIKDREINHYDGGATSKDLSQVLGHRRWIKKWTKQGAPVFKSVEEAVSYLVSF